MLDCAAPYPGLSGRDDGINNMPTPPEIEKLNKTRKRQKQNLIQGIGQELYDLLDGWVAERPEDELTLFDELYPSGAKRIRKYIVQLEKIRDVLKKTL